MQLIICWPADKWAAAPGWQGDDVRISPRVSSRMRWTLPRGRWNIVRRQNRRFRVFRAKSDEAILTLSDWPAPSAPGGDVGHKVIWDFIKVQSFFAGADL